MTHDLLLDVLGSGRLVRLHQLPHLLVLLVVLLATELRSEESHRVFAVLEIKLGVFALKSFVLLR